MSSGGAVAKGRMEPSHGFAALAAQAAPLPTLTPQSLLLRLPRLAASLVAICLLVSGCVAPRRLQWGACVAPFPPSTHTPPTPM